MDVIRVFSLALIYCIYFFGRDSYSFFPNAPMRNDAQIHWTLLTWLRGVIQLDVTHTQTFNAVGNEIIERTDEKKTKQGKEEKVIFTERERNEKQKNR